MYKLQVDGLDCFTIIQLVLGRSQLPKFFFLSGLNSIRLNYLLLHVVDELFVLTKITAFKLCGK